MRKMQFAAVSNGGAKIAVCALAFCAPLLGAATSIEMRPAPAALTADPVVESQFGTTGRRELACWLGLSIGTGGIVALSRRRRRVTTA